MTDQNRDQVPVHLRFGGGRRLMASRRRMVLDAAMKERWDVAYLTFGEDVGRGPSMAFVVRHTERRVYVDDCDLWTGADGRMHFVTRDGHHDFISLEDHRLVLTGRCPVGEYDTGRKRARTTLKAMQVERPGNLRDQHFFENCQLSQPITVFTMTGRLKPALA